MLMTEAAPQVMGSCLRRLAVSPREPPQLARHFDGRSVAVWKSPQLIAFNRCSNIVPIELAPFLLPQPFDDVLRNPLGDFIPAPQAVGPVG